MKRARVGKMMMRASGGYSSISNGVVCPKPRRLGGFFNSPSNYHTNQSITPFCLLEFSGQIQACDSEPGTELLDIILTKETSGAGKLNTHAASSPPFFFGSPPSRASNPLIQDAHFGNENFVPFPPPLATLTSPSSSSPSSARKNGGGCGVKFGHKPAPVRIEGFNCNGNCRVSAVA